MHRVVAPAAAFVIAILLGTPQALAGGSGGNGDASVDSSGITVAVGTNPTNARQISLLRIR